MEAETTQAAEASQIYSQGIDPPLLFWDLSGGVIIGIAVGYAIKKGSKIALLLLGMSVIFLYGLSYLGYLTVNWDLITQDLQSGSESTVNWIYQLTKELGSKVIGFSGGLLIGMKMR